MGRHSTGSICTIEVPKISITQLFKRVKMGEANYFTMSWTNGSNISVLARLDLDRPYIRLLYTTTDGWGDSWDMDYKIYLTSVPSNLGKGFVWYFICPQSGKNCRILYKCYGSRIWKSREAYSHRIYYPSQICSKRDLWNTRYWDAEGKLERLRERMRRTVHKGKPTKIARKITYLEWQLELLDYKRIEVLSKMLGLEEKFKELH